MTYMPNSSDATPSRSQRCAIYISDWQMQCCGTPFKIGDAVGWLVCKYEDDWQDKALHGAEYYYEHHSADWNKLYMATGIVDTIIARYCRYESLPNPNMKQGSIRYPVYQKSVGITEADGWEADIDGLVFFSYLVELRDCTIRPAKEDEVTFE